MKLRSMKLTKSESGHGGCEVAMPSKDSGPRYPYGLEIRLNNEALEKLGIALPKVGTSARVIADCCVTSVSSNERQKGQPNRSVELQIERLAVNDAEPTTMEEALEKGIKEA